MRIRLLSRASALARLQTALVERALGSAHPQLDVQCLTRTSAGDQDQTSPLWKLPDKGAFTADISRALIDGDADIAVHSFKDLPTEMPAGTRIAGALPRADARDVFVTRKTTVTARPEALRILSSSPRRAWLLGETLPALLPWPVRSVEAVPVRGNIETRLKKLVQGEEHGLVVAKAALDRLLGFGTPFVAEAATIRGCLDRCQWMVLPMREFPWAPAQGAIALEIPEHRSDLDDLLKPILCEPTTASVHYERQILNDHGGGCHQALGAATVTKPYGRVVSIRSRDRHVSSWQLAGGAPGVSACRRGRGVASTLRRRSSGSHVHGCGATGWRCVSRVACRRPAGERGRCLKARSCGRPAARHGASWPGVACGSTGVRTDWATRRIRPSICSAGRILEWISLTHEGASRPGAVATYHVEVPLPDDLASRSHFYWTSGEIFRRAIDRWPSIRQWMARVGTGPHAAGD